MLMMLQNLGNAGSAVVVDISEYLALASGDAIGISISDDGRPIAAQDDAVQVRTD